MDIKRSGSQPSAKGPAEYFTGTVGIDPLFEAHDRARTLGASVTFEQACSDNMAHPPVGTDPDRDGWLRSRTALGRLDRANSSGGCGLVRAGPEALARCHGNHCYDTHRHSGIA